MMDMIPVTRNWIVVDNNWHLLVEVNRKVFHKTFIVYDTSPGFESTLDTNKKLKEADLAEEIRKELGVKVKFV